MSLQNTQTPSYQSGTEMDQTSNLNGGIETHANMSHYCSVLENQVRSLEKQIELLKSQNNLNYQLQKLEFLIDEQKKVLTNFGHV